MTKRFHIEVIGVGGYLPDREVTNQDLTDLMDTSDRWIKSRTGISSRRFASIDQATSDLGVKSSELALQDANLSPEDIDLIIVSTITPDYYMPGIGVIIQHKLGIRPIQSIDLRGQCAGFTWSLSTADAYAQLGKYQHILVVGADLQSRILDFSTEGRNTAVLFGDGAGSLVLKVKNYDDDFNVSKVIDHELGSDGAGVDELIVKRPGMSAGNAHFITKEDLENKTTVPVMDGRSVFKNAIYYLEKTFNTLLSRNNLSVDDIDLVIPHQANLRINQMLIDKLNMPSKKWVNVINYTGNTTSATIPLGISHAIKDGRLSRGKLLITIAFGSGYTWGGNLIRW